MSISKEIFGIERKKTDITIRYLNDLIDKISYFGFNQCIDEIDKYELSEEELANIIYKEATGYSIGEAQPGGCNTIIKLKCDRFAKAIIQNQSKIFVRKT